MSLDTHTHNIIYMYYIHFGVQWYIQVILFIICYVILSKFVVLSHLWQQWNRTEITIHLLALLPEYGSFPLFLCPWVPDTSPWQIAKYYAIKITTSLSLFITFCFEVSGFWRSIYRTRCLYYNLQTLVQLCHAYKSYVAKHMACVFFNLMPVFMSIFRVGEFPESKISLRFENVSLCFCSLVRSWSSMGNWRYVSTHS